MTKRPKGGSKSAGIVRVGIGGWNFEPWRGSFYPDGLPQKRELEFASRALSTIEINSTFYGTQNPATFARWHDETPDDFVFAVKGPRYATNRRDLATAGASIDRFLRSGVLRLGPKLGPINWQFPPTKKFDPHQFQSFLSLLPKSVDGHCIRHAVEVRHDSFRCAEFVEMADKRDVAIVIAGDSDYPMIADALGSFVYARLMGSSATQPKGYAALGLRKWTAAAKSWQTGSRPGKPAPIMPETAPRYAKRDVFVYVIAGFKERNPTAAIALLAAVNR